MAALTPVLNFLYPPRCAACGTRFASATGAACARDASRESSGCRLRAAKFAAVRSNPRRERCDAMCAMPRAAAAHYRVARAIARYRTTAEDEPGSSARADSASQVRPRSIGRARAGGIFSATSCRLGAKDYDVVIPVPLHWRRLRWRGFNQAALLAAEVARRLDVPLDTTAMIAPRRTAPQTARHHDERIKNVRRAFAVTQSRTHQGSPRADCRRRDDDRRHG